MSGALEMADVIRKARYGHRDWVLWTDREGMLQADRACRDAVKRALLSCGTQRPFLIAEGSTGILHRYWFSDGVRMMRNAKHLWGRL